MGSVLKYAVVNTKIKYLQGKMLTKDQYVDLLKTVDYWEALKYIKDKTNYAALLSEFNLEDIHRGKLEIILKRNYIKNFNKLYHYFNGEHKKLFKLLFIKYEIEDLKTILRGKYVYKKQSRIRELLAYKSPLNNIDYEALLKTENVEQVISELKGSIYYKYLYPLMGTVHTEGLFRMEMTLDFVYFSSIRNYIKNIDKEDREIIYKFKGIMADLLNLQWIYRGIKYYHIKSEILLNYTIYDGLRLKRDVLKNLCYSKNLEEFYEKVNKSYYKEIFKSTKEEDFLVEKETLTHLKRVLLKYRKQNKNNISVVLSYLYLALIEIRDIISIVESKRYKLDNETTIKYITVTL